MTHLYLNTQQSLLKFCGDFISANGLRGFENFDFDAHAGINRLPEKDLVGVGEFSIQNDIDDCMVTCFIAVSTRADDANLGRLRKAVDLMFERLSPGNILDIVDAAEGHKIGVMTVARGVSVLPVARTETRPMQMLGVSLSVALTP